MHRKLKIVFVASESRIALWRELLTPFEEAEWDVIATADYRTAVKHAPNFIIVLGFEDRYVAGYEKENSPIPTYWCTWSTADKAPKGAIELDTRATPPKKLLQIVMAVVYAPPQNTALQNHLWLLRKGAMGTGTKCDLPDCTQSSSNTWQIKIFRPDVDGHPTTYFHSCGEAHYHKVIEYYGLKPFTMRYW